MQLRDGRVSMVESSNIVSTISVLCTTYFVLFFVSQHHLLTVF